MSTSSDTSPELGTDVQHTHPSSAADPTATPADTVEHAAATPDLQLPWAELGLKQDEYDEVVGLLGRRPTAAELAM